MTDRPDSDESTVHGELVPCGGGDPIPLLKARLLVGRRSSCDVSLTFPNVSSHHCELELRNGYWWVRDVGSRNGIKVNGERCDSNWLMPGDILHIAKHRYEVTYEPQADGPPPDEHDPMELSLLEKAGLASRERRERRSTPPRQKKEDPAGDSADSTAHTGGPTGGSAEPPSPPAEDRKSHSQPEPAPPRVNRDTADDDPIMQWLSNESDADPEVH